MRSPTANAVDQLAQRLAEQAGVVWWSLSNHPGYQKFIWREKARVMLALSGVEAGDEDASAVAAAAPRFLD